MIFQKNVLHKHISSAIFASVFMLIAIAIMINEKDVFSLLLFAPICCIVLVVALSELFGNIHALTHNKIYIKVEDDTITYYNYYGKEIYRISKNNVLRIIKEEEYLKVYVKEKRKLSMIDKIRSVFLEEQSYMYPLMIYGDWENTELLGHKIESATMETLRPQYVALSRYLFSFIFACVMWYLISDIFVTQITYFALLIGCALIFFLDFMLNATNLSEASWGKATVKCLSMGLLFAFYLSLASFDSDAIIFQDRGLELLKQKNYILCFAIVACSFVMLMFKNNIVTFIQDIKSKKYKIKKKN